MSLEQGELAEGLLYTLGGQQSCTVFEWLYPDTVLRIGWLELSRQFSRKFMKLAEFIERSRQGYQHLIMCILLVFLELEAERRQHEGNIVDPKINRHDFLTVNSDALQEGSTDARTQIAVMDKHQTDILDAALERSDEERELKQVLLASADVTYLELLVLHQQGFALEQTFLQLEVRFGKTVSIDDRVYHPRSNRLR
jgi:hypothetical protein